MLPVAAGGLAGSAVRRRTRERSPRRVAASAGGATVVRLLAAAGDDEVRLACAGVGEQELELPDLVAGELGAGQVVRA
jgi:hypothetical protein